MQTNKMLILALSIIISASILPITTRAEDTAATANETKLEKRLREKELFTAKIEEIKERRDERREEKFEKQALKKRETLARNTNLALDRIVKIIEDIFRLSDRLETQLTKLDEKGVDTDESFKLLQQAREQNKVALEETKDIRDLVNDSLLGTSTISLSASQIKDLLKNVEGDVQNSRETLMESIRSANPKYKRQKTSTTSAEIQNVSDSNVASSTATSTSSTE
jgi:hypothetical protein